MKHETFDAILEDRLTKTREVLGKKKAEYATADRLHNFKRAAAITGETPAQVCVGFMVKHTVSVLDIVDEFARGSKGKSELIDEKIGDAINYLILLEAILKETTVSNL